MRERLVIADEAASTYLGELSASLSEIDFECCSNRVALEHCLENFRPTIAYSCVSHGFPRQEHQLLAAQQLKWLHVGGSGFDHFAGMNTNSTLLTNGRGVLAPFLADTVIGALIALNHGFLGFHQDQLDGAFSARTHKALFGQKLLVIGPGAIGTELARKAKCLGLTCIGIARRQQPIAEFDEVFGFERLSDILPLVDMISVHVPLTENTRNLIGEAELALLKPSALLANCARGGVVNERVLVRRLKSGLLRGAYLDVFEQEPLPSDSPLRHLPNVLLTPHCADQVSDWQARHAKFFARNLERWQNNEPLLNRIKFQAQLGGEALEQGVAL